MPAQYAVIRNGKPNPLSVDYTGPGYGKRLRYQVFFALGSYLRRFLCILKTRMGAVSRESLSYSYRPISYGEFTLDADDVQAYLAENGYELVPPEQSHTVNYGVDASGNDVFEPSKVVFIVRPIRKSRSQPSCR